MLFLGLASTGVGTVLKMGHQCDSTASKSRIGCWGECPFRVVEAAAERPNLSKTPTWMKSQTRVLGILLCSSA